MTLDFISAFGREINMIFEINMFSIIKITRWIKLTYLFTMYFMLQRDRVMMIYKCYNYRWHMTRLNNIKKYKQEIYISLSLHGVCDGWLYDSYIKKRGRKRKDIQSIGMLLMVDT